MRKRVGVGRGVAVVLAILGAVAAEARAQGQEWNRVNAAAMVLDDIAIRNQKDLPPLVLRRAYAVAVFPEVIKAGFVFGGRVGHGVILIRGAEGWSNPAFATISGASFGAQIGVQSTDLVLVFKNRRSLEGFLRNKGKATLGVDGSAAIGALGGHAEAAAGIGFQSEIVALSRNRGLFAGASIAGSAITFDARANARFYGRPISPNEIFTNCCMDAPEPAATLRQVLAARSGITPQPRAPRGEVAGTPEVLLRGVQSDVGGVIVEEGPSRLDSILDDQWGVPGDPPVQAPSLRSGPSDPAVESRPRTAPAPSTARPGAVAPLNDDDLPATVIEPGAGASRGRGATSPLAPTAAPTGEPPLDLEALPALEAPATNRTGAKPSAAAPAAGDQPSWTRPNAVPDDAGPTRVRATNAWRPLAPAHAQTPAGAAVAASKPAPAPSMSSLDPLPLATYTVKEIPLSGWKRVTPLPTATAGAAPLDPRTVPASTSAAALAPTEISTK